MKTAKAVHKSTGRMIEVEIYTSFVYFIEEIRTISRSDFDEFYKVIA